MGMNTLWSIVNNTVLMAYLEVNNTSKSNFLLLKSRKTMLATEMFAFLKIALQQ